MFELSSGPHNRINVCVVVPSGERLLATNRSLGGVMIDSIRCLAANCVGLSRETPLVRVVAYDSACNSMKGISLGSSARDWGALDDFHPVPCRDCLDEQSSPEVFAFLTAALLTTHAGAVEQLLAQVKNSGFVCCTDQSGQLFAFAVHSSQLPHVARFLRLISSRVRARAGLDDVGPSPIVLDTKIVSRPFASPYFVNTALAEVLYQPADGASPLSSTEDLRAALMRHKEQSSVPWIFNELLNGVEFRSGAREPESIPPEVHLSITGTCNIECQFCSYTHAAAKKAFVSFADMAKLEFLKNVRTLRLHSGNGEPTTNPHLSDIIEYVEKAYPQISLDFFTNGIKLDRPGLIHALVGGNVEWINISLNAAKPDTWRALCGLDHFDRVCANIERLNDEKRRRRASRPVLHGSMVLTRTTTPELPEMPGLCHRFGIERFTAIPFFSLGYERKDRFGPEEAYHHIGHAYDELYRCTVERAAHYGISIELPLPRAETTSEFGLEKRAHHDFAGLARDSIDIGRFLVSFPFEELTEPYCHFLWRQAAIGSVNEGHGRTLDTHFLYPCLGPLAALGPDEATVFKFPDEEGFKALWRNPVLTLLRQGQHERGLVPVCDACRACDTRAPESLTSLSELLQTFGRRVLSMPASPRARTQEPRAG